MTCKPHLIEDEEFRRLEQAPLERMPWDFEELCKEEIKLWGNIILEGFARYTLLRQRDIPIRMRQIPVRNRREALDWACTVQLKRDDLNDDMRIYLLGKRYSLEKGIQGKNILQPLRTSVENPETEERKLAICKTAIRLGAEYGLARCTIARYGLYADAVDQLADVAPKLVELILSGRLGLAQRDVIRLSKAPEQILQQAEENPAEFIVKNCLQGKKRGRPPIQQGNHPDCMSIKQMPDHDPDAEISGLTLTIPSWIGSIQRACSVAEIPKISSHALEQLTIQLCRLTESAGELLAAIKEVP